MIWIAAAAFGLFLLSDLNDLYGIHKILQASFFIGCLLLAFSTIKESCAGTVSLPLFIRIPAMILALFFLLLLLLSLFGSFSPREGYRKQGQNRMVYKKKLYALSRHPGVFFLISFYFCLCPAFSVPVLFSAVVSLLDLALAVFEDRKVFPAVLSGYSDYQKETPFLFPTRNSIFRCISDFDETN